MARAEDTAALKVFCSSLAMQQRSGATGHQFAYYSVKKLAAREHISKSEAEQRLKRLAADHGGLPGLTKECLRRGWR